jgi:hypothetical protein
MLPLRLMQRKEPLVTLGSGSLNQEMPFIVLHLGSKIGFAQHVGCMRPTDANE